MDSVDGAQGIAAAAERSDAPAAIRLAIALAIGLDTVQNR